MICCCLGRCIIIPTCKQLGMSSFRNWQYVRLPAPFVFVCVFACLFACLLVCLLVCLFPCFLVSLFAFLLSCLHELLVGWLHLLVGKLVYLFACLLADKLVCVIDGLLANTKFKPCTNTVDWQREVIQMKNGSARWKLKN